jgi:integrase
MMIMLSTAMGFDELRQLRRLDVDIERGCIMVREGAKKTNRQRTIPPFSPYTVPESVSDRRRPCLSQPHE